MRKGVWVQKSFSRKNSKWVVNKEFYFCEKDFDYFKNVFKVVLLNDLLQNEVYR